jgi:hypothetical protein
MPAEHGKHFTHSVNADTLHDTADKVAAVGSQLFDFVKEALVILGHTIMDILAQFAIFCANVWQIVS